MDKAAYGLLGVVMGVLLTIAKEWWFQNLKNKKDAEYLAIQMVSMLDRYVAGCAAVVGDDGLYRGQADSNGYSSIQVHEDKEGSTPWSLTWNISLIASFVGSYLVPVTPTSPGDTRSSTHG